VGEARREMRFGRGCGPFGEQTYLCRPTGYRAAPPIVFWAAQVERFSETFCAPSNAWSLACRRRDGTCRLWVVQEAPWGRRTGA